MLLGLRHTALKPAAASLDLLSKADLHLLQFIEHEPQTGIHRLLSGVVIEKWLHGTTKSDTKC
jgi:hypothetical protein